MNDDSVWKPVEDVLDTDLLKHVQGGSGLTLPTALQIQTIRELKRLNDNVIDVENAGNRQS